MKLSKEIKTAVEKYFNESGIIAESMRAALIAIKKPVRSGAQQAQETQKALQAIYHLVKAGQSYDTACAMIRQKYPYGDTAEDMTQAAAAAMGKAKHACFYMIIGYYQSIEKRAEEMITCGMGKHKPIMIPVDILIRYIAPDAVYKNVVPAARKVYDDKRGGRFDESLVSWDEIEEINRDRIKENQKPLYSSFTEFEHQREHVQLVKAELAQLVSEKVKPKDKDTAVKATMMKLEGMKLQDIANELERSTSTIHFWTSRLLQVVTKEYYNRQA